MTNASISATNTRDLQNGVLNCVGLCLYYVQRMFYDQCFYKCNKDLQNRAPKCVGLCLYDHCFYKCNKLCYIMNRVCSMTNVSISATNTKQFAGFY